MTFEISLRQSEDGRESYEGSVYCCGQLGGYLDNLGCE